jgi:hypothetical protein
MPAPPKLTPLEVFDKLIRRVEKRIDALQRVGLDGFKPVLAELAEEAHFLHRGRDYLEKPGQAPRQDPFLRHHYLPGWPPARPMSS